MQLYEVALAQDEASRELMVRARRLGMGKVTATTDLSDDQIRRLYPHRLPPQPGGAAGQGEAGPSRGDAGGGPPRSSPPMGVVAASLIAALVALATGMAILGGASPGDASGPQQATATRPADEAVVAADAVAVAPLQVLDPAALCAGWPGVQAYWDRFAVQLSTAADLDGLASWAEDNHRGAAMALRDEVGPAFGGDGRGPEVRDVLRWVFDTAYPTDSWDLERVRVVTEAAAPSVASLAQAAATAC